MTASIPNELLEAAIQCMRLHQERERLTPTETLRSAADQVERLLRNAWERMARVYAAAEEDCYADPDHVGYIVRCAEGAEVRVPCHLAGDFPHQEDLLDLVRLAQAVRVSGDGIICISGSATFLGSLCWVADLDYCEYVDQARTSSLHAALQGAQGMTDPPVVCIRVVARDHSNVGVELDSGAAIARAKLDFIAHLERRNEVVEATNVVLPVGVDDLRSLAYSFALQEAPVGDGAWLPQNLLSPPAFGRYAVWLMNEVSDKLAGRQTIKAAKRGLSLARLCGLGTMADEIVALLNSNGAALRAAQQAREALRQSVRERVPKLIEALEYTIRKLDGGDPVSPSDTDALHGYLSSVHRFVADRLETSEAFS